MESTMTGKNVFAKVIWHKPSKKWLTLVNADAVYGHETDEIEKATLFFEKDVTVTKALQGVCEIDPDPTHYEMRDVEINYWTEDT